MPKIIGQAEQQKALKDITSALKEVAIVNAFLQAKNPSGKYTVTFTDASNEKHHCSLFTPDKEDLDLLVLNYKDQLKTKILKLAEDYRIALEPEEQMMLDDSFPSEENAAPSSASVEAQSSYFGSVPSPDDKG